MMEVTSVKGNYAVLTKALSLARAVFISSALFELFSFCCLLLLLVWLLMLMLLFQWPFATATAAAVTNWLVVLLFRS